GLAEAPAVGDTPEVELVRGTGVQAVDRVAAVDDAGTGEEHVPRAATVGREPAQLRRDHRGGVAAQQAGLAGVPGVAGVAGGRAGGVAEAGVVVLDGYERAGAHGPDLAAPRG